MGSINRVIAEIEYELKDHTPGKKGVSKVLVAILLKAFKRMRNDREEN